MALGLGDCLDHKTAVDGVIKDRPALARTPHASEVILLGERILRERRHVSRADLNRSSENGVKKKCYQIVCRIDAERLANAGKDERGIVSELKVALAVRRSRARALAARGSAGAGRERDPDNKEDLGKRKS